VNRRSWLEIAEYFSLAGSVAGSITAIASQQVAFAAAPLTLALSLNAVNRHRYQQQTQHETSNAIAVVRQFVQSLQQQVQALPSEPVDKSSITQSLEHLEQKTQRLSEQFNARPETQVIAQLKNQLSDLVLRLDNLPNPPELADLSGVEAEIATLQAHLQTLDHSPLASTIAQVKTELLAQINQLGQQIQDLPQPFDPSTLSQRLASLEQNHTIFSDDINHLVSGLQSLELDKVLTTEALLQLTNQLKALEELRDHLPTSSSEPLDLSGIQEALADLNAKQTALAQEFSTRPETLFIAQLTNRLDAVELQLNNLPTSPEPVDLSGILGAIADLNLQLDDQRCQFNARPEPTAIQRLDAIVALTVQRLDELPLPTDSIDLSGIEELKREVEQLVQKFQIVSHLAPEIEELKQRQLSQARMIEIQQQPKLDISTVDLHAPKTELQAIEDQWMSDELQQSLEELAPPLQLDFELFDLFPDQVDTSVEQLHQANAETLLQSDSDLFDLFSDQVDTSVEQLHQANTPVSPQSDLELEIAFSSQVDTVMSLWDD